MAVDTYTDVVPVRRRARPDVPDFATRYAGGPPGSIPTPAAPDAAPDFAGQNQADAAAAAQATARSARTAGAAPGSFDPGLPGQLPSLIDPTQPRAAVAPTRVVSDRAPVGIGAVQTPVQTSASTPVSVPPLTRAATQLPTQTVRPPNPADPVASGAFAPSSTAPAWTGGGSPNGSNAGQRTLPGGISMIRGADGVPIFTNVPANTRAELQANNGKLPMTADQSLTFPGVSSLVGNGQGGYTGGTSGVAGTNPSVSAAALPGAIAPYDAQADVEDTQRNAISDITSILSKDPRSPLGVAARNAGVDLVSAGRDLNGNRVRGGRFSGGGLPGGIDELIGGVNLGAHANTTAALDRSRQDNALQLAGNRDASETQREGMRLAGELNKPSYQTDAEGNLVLVRGASAQPVNAGGKPLAVQGKLNGPQDATYREAYGRAYAAHIANNDDAETANEKAIAAAQGAVAGMKGGAPTAGAKPSKADFLKAAAAKNPGVSQADLEKYYDEKYGK